MKETNQSTAWLREKAALEDESLISVGGLVTRIDNSSEFGSPPATESNENQLSDTSPLTMREEMTSNDQVRARKEKRGGSR